MPCLFLCSVCFSCCLLRLLLPSLYVSRCVKTFTFWIRTSLLQTMTSFVLQRSPPGFSGYFKYYSQWSNQEFSASPHCPAQLPSPHLLLKPNSLQPPSVLPPLPSLSRSKPDSDRSSLSCFSPSSSCLSHLIFHPI